LLISKVIAVLNYLFVFFYLNLRRRCSCWKHCKGRWTDLFTRRSACNQQKHWRYCCRTEHLSLFCRANCKIRSSSDCISPCRVPAQVISDTIGRVSGNSFILRLLVEVAL